MTPLRLRADRLGVLRDVDLDLDALPPGIIAVVGKNGEGKSTFLDAIGFAPLYRSWSSKPKELRDYCPGPARLDLDVAMDGHTYGLRLRIDPTAKGGAGQTDATLTRDGEPLTAGTRTTDYDLAVCDWPGRDGKPGTRGVFPSRRLWLASAFAAQDRAGGFASLGPADRKALFGELLGTEEHQERSVAARARGADLDVKLAALTADLDRIEADRARAQIWRADLASAEADLAAARDREAGAEREVSAAQQALAAARADLDVVDRERASIAARRAELDRDLSIASVDLIRTGRELADLDALLSREGTIRTRAAELTTATGAYNERRAEYALAKSALDAAHVALERACLTSEDAARQVERLAADVRALDADRARFAEVAARAARSAELRREIEATSTTLATLTTQARDLRRTADRAAADARVASRDAAAKVADAERRAGLLDGVPCKGREGDMHGSPDDPDADDTFPADCGRCPLLSDANEARDALFRLRADLARTEDSTASAAARVAAADAEEAKVGLLTTALAELRTEAAPLRAAEEDYAVLTSRIEAGVRAGAALDEARARAAAAADQVVAAQTAVDEAEARVESATTAGREAKRAYEALAGADLDLRKLEVSLGSAVHLRTAHATATAARSKAASAIEALPVAPDPEARRRAVGEAALVVGQANAALNVLRADARLAADRAARARGALDGIGDLDARAAELTAERGRLALRRAGYAELERGFGRDGIQALEIDAAGPEVSALTNELLATVSGGRYSASLVTLQEASGSRKQREVFDLRVLDGDRDHSGVPFEFLSIGEQCLVGEALKLAIAVRNTRRSGRELRTLYRDEGDRDLDAERRASYPAMLRRAMELGGFTRCYLISHDERVWSQADAIIRVEGGGVSIVR